MNEAKSFILGFSLSIFGVSLYSGYCQTEELPSIPQNTIKLELFKEAKAEQAQTNMLHANIKKQTISEYKIADNTILSNINSDEDDEILTINTPDIIPIEHNILANSHTSILNEEKNEKVAMLPNTATNYTKEDSPWVIAKGSKKIDNKNLLEKYNDSNIDISLSLEKQPEDLPINIAEKIKQSIIFPIPNEILSDENLTPTFISSKTQKIEKKEKQHTPRIIEKKQVNSDKSNLLDNISSWLKPQNKPETENNKTKNKVAAPIYNSQPTTNKQNKTTSNKSIGDIYTALQKTKDRAQRNNITPTELKLSFSQGRAEISGQTLRWLKAFSEKTKENYTLQVKLDKSTPLDLQKKRLNLLYTIFTNNGADINKIDTSFAPIEANTFIIRTTKTQDRRYDNTYQQNVL